MSKKTNEVDLVKAVPQVPGSMTKEKNWEKYVTKEVSVTEAKSRMPAQAPSKHPKKPSVKMSSRDSDPALRIGGFNFGEKGLGIGAVAQAFGRDGEVKGSFNAGFSVLTFRGYKPAGPRPDCPPWVLNRDIIAFVRSRLKSEGQNSPTVSLDYVILNDYYRNRLTDEEIFADYKSWFRKEKTGKRWTSTPQAVKNRRFRLVKDAEDFFNKVNVLKIQDLSEQIA